IQILDEIGVQFEKKTKIAYLRTNFKKKDGYLMSIRLSKALNIYRQDYCGCEYGLKEKENFQEEKVKNG
ncbi:epoxyqueuosine reductase QueH, partial [Candidatus Calescamantes bacterium]|nr:epoxyqueuosine reductase QueH [Candidatus Calescamantes bacterium]